MALMIAMATAVCYDLPRMTSHSGGFLSMYVMIVAFLIAVILGVLALRKRRWLRVAMLAAVIVFVFVCDCWISWQVPPCADCDPKLYAEWLEDKKG